MSSQKRAEIDRMYAQLDAQDHFTLLSVDRTTPQRDVKAAYVALAKKWHPDSGDFAGIDLGDSRERLGAIFQRIGEAYEVVSDPTERANYITLLDRKRAGLSTDVDSILRGETKVDEGLNALSKKQWAQAETSFAEAKRLNPDDPLIWAHRAWAQYRRDRATSEAAGFAIAELQNAIKEQDNLPEAYQYLGTIAFEQDDLRQAIPWLQRCVNRDRRNVEAARLLRLARSRLEKQKETSWVEKLTDAVSGFFKGN